ncbi:putative serine protease K12H4.7 [Danaus plexippus]|uniref:putative serine protease K12H4.7 n=1 Tax=Danaus plexippus TaxID=13037 RepID=UPI002AB18DAD|nr:putative serine protease K12H4.7 [Danaus plexippus]
MCCVKHFVLLIILQQYTVNGFSIFNLYNGFKYLNNKINSIVPANLPDIHVKMRWILQELDHFDPKNLLMFNMRYFENVLYWQENGPIFVFLGGESASSPQWTRFGIIHELAKESQGAMYVTEHRYYGESKPKNLTKEDQFKYLSSRQALADIAKLIHYLKLLPMYKNSKVVVIGGSYAGNLAAWMKVLYPDLVDAAVASSAPVLAKKDFFEYLEKVTEDYETYGTHGCSDKIKNIFDRFHQLLQSSEGIKQLKKEENICDSCDMSVIENQAVFFEVKTSIFMSNSQYGSTKTIKQHCEKLSDVSYDTKSLTDNSMLPIIYSEKLNCYDYDFNRMIQVMKSNDDLFWIYQTCTEFGYYQTTNSKAQIFKNIPLEFYIKICTEMFGNDFNETRVDQAVKNTNKLYGGLNPNVTKVVFSNGNLDPWSTIGVLEGLSYDAPAVVIPRSTHCADLLPIFEPDNEELKEARKHIKYLIKKWIGIEEYLTS